MPVVTTPAVNHIDQRVALAIVLMDRHRESPLSVARLATLVNVSPSYLTRLFREQTGLSPASFDRVRRLDHAHELIVTSLFSVKQIMAAVGWNDPSHFSREFKRRFGLSPRALRVTVRG